MERSLTRRWPGLQPPIGLRVRARRTALALASALTLVVPLAVGATPASALSGDLRVHDPSIIKAGDCYYAFSTGLGGGAGNGSLQIRRSCGTGARTGWTFIGTVHNDIPSWVTQKLGSKPPNLWAPDINYMNGTYYLYYSGAVWGSPPAVLGVATASSPAGPWTDRGMVTDQHAPIDPNLAWLGSTPYLLYGGFSGVWIQRVDPGTGKVMGSSTQLATRMENSSISFSGGYYYLYGSKGGCCNGTASTYYTVVARSTSLTGPYLDKSGNQMMSGSGSTILSGAGSGGGDVFDDGSAKKFAYHYYDPNNNGLERLDIRPLGYSGGWPVFGNPIGP